MTKHQNARNERRRVAEGRRSDLQAAERRLRELVDARGRETTDRGRELVDAMISKQQATVRQARAAFNQVKGDL